MITQKLCCRCFARTVVVSAFACMQHWHVCMLKLDTKYASRKQRGQISTQRPHASHPCSLKELQGAHVGRLRAADCCACTRGGSRGCSVSATAQAACTALGRSWRRPGDHRRGPSNRPASRAPCTGAQAVMLAGKQATTHACMRYDLLCCPEFSIHSSECVRKRAMPVICMHPRKARLLGCQRPRQQSMPPEASSWPARLIAKLSTDPW
jgi:hypothetical protein